jgi:peptide/nickel transport system substrate-binding protein
MHQRSLWLRLTISLLAIASLGLATVAATAHAAGTRAAKQNAASCTKKNKATGVLKYSDWQFPDTLNPYQTTSAVSTETLNGMLEGLVLYDNNAKLKPDLATAVPSIKNGGIKDGGKTIVVNLKQGLRWSDGAALTSKDVAFGWHVGMDPATGPSCSGSCDIISRIDTPSKYQAVLHLKKIYAPAVPNALPPIWPVKWARAWSNDAHAAAEKLGQDQTFNFESTNYPTNGAYQVTQFVNNDRIVLKPMKYYTAMGCGAQVSQLIFAFYSSKPALIAAAASHQTDVTQNYTAADLPDLKQHTNAYKLYTDAGFIFEHLEFNLDKTYNGNPNPLATLKVRQALALGLDKIGLVQSALGISAKEAKTVVAWTPWVNTPTLVQPFADKKITGQWDPIQKKYDPNTGRGKALADAKKLLSQTTYKDGFSLDFFTTSGNPVRQAQAAVTQASWARLNVKVNVNLVPSSKLFADWDHGGILDKGQFQVGMFAFLGNPEPDGFKYNMQGKYIDREKSSTHATINENYSGIKNGAIDKAFDTAAHTFDKKVRAANYATAQVQLNQNAYWVCLYFRPTIATADSKVGNFANNPTLAGPTWNMFNWKVKA